MPGCLAEGSVARVGGDEGHRRVLSRADGYQVEATWHGGDPVEVGEPDPGVAIAVVPRLSEQPGPFVVVHQEGLLGARGRGAAGQGESRTSAAAVLPDAIKGGQAGQAAAEPEQRPLMPGHVVDERVAR